MLAFALGFDAYAQTEAEVFTAKNTVFVEARWNAERDAAGYGRILHQKGRFKLSGSAGFSMWYYDRTSPSLRSTHWLPVVPLEVSALWGKSKHHLEIGTGIMPYLEPVPRLDPETSRRISDKLILSAELPIRVGYRYQKPEGGFFFRIGYVPAFHFSGDTGRRVSSPQNFGRINSLPIFVRLSLGMSF
ncbi:hypothetical protein [Negadavirga shengliensis]|uniref:Outer membrane protein beta-barrel domain-containing protein n=1 Tax=Negadavirga shengliensis TaxID=1389218 RepID=A0ABV9T283_9BACT